MPEIYKKKVRERIKTDDLLVKLKKPILPKTYTSSLLDNFP